MAQPVNAAAPSTAAPAGEGMMTDDQRFLLTVIFGTYFGPQLKGESPPYKSAMQRVRERLPRYTHDQLAGSQMMVVQMIHAYYHILRKADKSVVLALSFLRKFLHDTLPAKVLGPTSNYPRFTDLFPIDLHPWSFVEERFMAIDNVVFIDNPSTSFLREEVVARFKSLTGLQEFILDKDVAILPAYVTDKSFYEVVARDAQSEGQSHFSCLLVVLTEEDARAQLDGRVVFSPLNTTEVQYRGAAAACSAGVGVAGNADVRLTGSTTWRVNLAESEDCYLFQVSLPGVRRDQTFGWEVDMSGEVLIEGETATSGQVVESRTGSLCPSGHFSLCFQLPSRVDPRLSNCNFGSDGIFEGVVKKLIDN
ncbi:increased DNA methylation 3-like [Eucalyptus grandis]|uniref:increased DNA methylation 3-like n=1 Tax=Eucalyptus grandis TaxID=71139 RepID=UPI00192ECA06|nr:increased DNA methylation 3-like [Eucalyptus grandis]